MEGERQRESEREREGERERERERERGREGERERGREGEREREREAQEREPDVFTYLCMFICTRIELHTYIHILHQQYGAPMGLLLLYLGAFLARCWG